MKHVLFGVGVLLTVAAIGLWNAADNILQQQVGALFGIVAAVLLSGSTIAYAIDKSHEELYSLIADRLPEQEIYPIEEPHASSKTPS